MATIAFIGLGNMGAPMAANLLAAGHSVRVFDLVPTAVEAMLAKGATTAESAQQICQGADFVISMLPAGQHVEQLYVTDGLLAQLDTNTIVIDCSTIAADTARAVAGKANDLGIAMIDAPVSGGTAGAQAGTLTFICGGEAAVYEKARLVLADMGKNIFLAGGHGAGQVAKMCNNMLLSVLMLGTAEALQLGVDHGLDPATLSEIMKQSSGDNWVLQKYNPFPGVMDGVPASKEYQGGFMSRLMLKDLGLALDAAGSSGSAIPMGMLARNFYAQHCKQGQADLDFSSIMQQFMANASS